MDTWVEGNTAGRTPFHRQGRSPGSSGEAWEGEAGEDEPTLREPTEADQDPGFGIHVSCWGERWSVRVSGEVDAPGAAAIVDVAEVLAARQIPAVDLDFSAVTAIDTPGWRAALYAQSVLAASGAGCRLISPPSTLTHPSRSPRPHPGHAA